MTSVKRRVAINTRAIAAKVIDGEAIAINLTTGVYYSLDGVAGRIWALIEAGHDLDVIGASLAAEYDAPSDRCRADLTRLIEELERESLVVPANSHPEVPAPPTLGARQPYTVPQLQVYRDMGDLLALDPPIPGLEMAPWGDPGADASHTTS